MKISIAVHELETEAARLEAWTSRLAEALRGVDASLELPGLPAYVADARVAVEDMRRHVAELISMTALMRTRAFLAKVADGPGMGMLAMRLDDLERRNPDAFLKLLAMTTAEMVTSEGAGRGVPFAAERLARILGNQNIRMTPAQIAAARRALTLNAAAFQRQYKALTKTAVRLMVRGDAALGAAEAGSGAIARLPLKSPGGAGVLGAVVAGGFQLWMDRKQHFEGQDRLKRVGVASGAGLAAGGVTAVACTATGWLPCLGVGLVLGVTAGAGSNAVNERWFASKEARAAAESLARFDAQVREQRKLEQWYLANGRPSTSDLEARLWGTKSSSFRGNGGTIHEVRYRPADASVVWERITYPDGRQEEHYVDNEGKPVEIR